MLAHSVDGARAETEDGQQLQTLFAKAFCLTRTSAEWPVALTAAEMIPAGAGETIEHREAALLTLVKAFVKRLRSVSQFLQCCAGIGHGRGTSP